MSINQKKETIGYGAVFCSSKYRASTYLGISMAIFQQLTGINVIMAYSNKLFDGIIESAVLITFLIGLVNFLATILGAVIIGKYGRKAIMVVCSFIIAIILALNGVSILLHWNNYFVIAFTLLFIVFFEFSQGPIVWLYMAEIMQEKGQGVATMMNWGVNLLIGYYTPDLIDNLGPGSIFVVCGGATGICAIYLIMFMKETKGKTRQEIDEMFMSEKDREKLRFTHPAQIDENGNTVM